MVPEGRRIFSDLSVVENLVVGAFTRSDRRQVGKDLEMVLETQGVKSTFDLSWHIEESNVDLTPFLFIFNK